METVSRYNTRESFICELAFAMSDHDILEDQYLNLTQQMLSVIQREDYSWGKKWPAEGDEVILVDRTPSWEAFRQMEEFADSITDSRITRRLYNALGKRHPFSTFRYAAEQTGVIQLVVSMARTLAERESRGMDARKWCGLQGWKNRG